MASIVLSVAGGLLGASIGGPAGAYKGFMLGSMVGGFIDQMNAPVPDVGKLTDLRVSGSSEGANIPRVWGTAPVAANVIWVKEDANGNHLKQHKKKGRGGGSGGGGGSPGTYWYSASYAVLICQGSIFFPDDSHPLGGTFSHRNPVLKRYKCNDIVVFDSAAPKNIVVPAYYSGTETQGPDSTIVAAMGVSAGMVPAHRGNVYAVFTDQNLLKFGNSLPNGEAIIATDTVTVGDIFYDLARSAGIKHHQLDVSAANDPIRGFVALNQEAPAEAAARLLMPFAYDAVEVDGVLRLVKRGGATVFNIPAEHLGATDGQDEPKLTRSRRQLSDLPGRVTVQFLDAENDYQQGSESEARHSAGAEQLNTKTIYLPLVLTRDEARNIAARSLDTEWSELEDFTFSLPPRYLKYCPGDVGLLPTPTGVVRARLTKMTMAPIGQIKCEGVLDASNVVTQSTPGGGGGGAIPPFVPVPAVFDCWSGTELQEEDKSSAGFYVCAAPDPSVAGQWAGAVAWYSLDGGTSWIQGPVLGGETAFGVTTGALSSAGAAPDTYDDVNTVGVNLSVSAGRLESATDSQISGGSNHALVGNEVLGFGTPNLTSANNYTLSHLRRGELGSSMTGHVSGERFVELTDDIVRVNVSDAYVGTTVRVKVLTEFQVLGDVTEKTVVIAPKTGSQVDALRGQVLTWDFEAEGDIASYDGTGATRTAVGWTEADIATIVTAGTKAVLLTGVGNDGGDSAGRQAIEVKKDAASTKIKTVFEGSIDGDDSDIHGSGFTICPVTDDLKIHYRVLVGFRNGWKLRITGALKTPS